MSDIIRAHGDGTRIVLDTGLHQMLMGLINTQWASEPDSQRACEHLVQTAATLIATGVWTMFSAAQSAPLEDTEQIVRSIVDAAINQSAAAVAPKQ